MARQVSFAPIRGTVPRISTVAGLFTSMVAPLSASHQRPPIYACCRKRSESCRESVVVILLVSWGKSHARFQAKAQSCESFRQDQGENRRKQSQIARGATPNGSIYAYKLTRNTYYRTNRSAIHGEPRRQIARPAGAARNIWDSFLDGRLTDCLRMND